MKITKIKQCLIVSFLHIALIASGQQSLNQPRLIVPFGHQLGIRHSLFSPDNKLIITADKNISIISDVRSGKPLYYLNGTNPAISASGRHIATVMDTLVMVWNTANGALLRTLKLPQKAIRTEFNPIKELLLVEHLAGEESENPHEQFYNITLWDFTKDLVLKEFPSGPQGGKSTGANCDECKGKSCPIYAAWFTNAGDSIRFVYDNLIKTFSVDNYNTARKVCLIRPEKNNTVSMVKILNNHTIELDDNESAFCFNEYGQMVCSWPLQAEGFANYLNAGTVNACISPAYNYQAAYTNRKITLRDLKTQKNRLFEVESGEITKLSFNQAGTHVLVQYLDEAPRILLTNSFSTSIMEAKDYEGFPEYIYETKTAVDAAAATAVFDSMTAKVSPDSKARKMAGKIFGVPGTRDILDNMTSGMKKDAKGTFTNSGEIVNLTRHRTISKIESLIKMSGDIKLSPDNKVMLLNTGKILSVYSIPYAKILINLKGNSLNKVFSPDSKWLALYQPGVKASIINLASGEVKSVELKLPVSHLNTIHFSADSKLLTISSGEGGYAVIDVEKGALNKTVNDLCYFPSPQGDKYGIIDPAARTVRIYSQRDSSQLFTTDLGAKSDKKKQSSEHYRIAFSSGSDAIAIWSERKLIYLKDLHHPAETVMVASEESGAISTVSMGPGSKYLIIYHQGGVPVIFNTQDRELSFRPIAEGEAGWGSTSPGAMMGQMFRSMYSGNTEALTGARETMQFSQTGDSVLVCQHDSALIYACATGARLSGFKVAGEIKYGNFSNNLLIAYYYGQLKFYHLDTRQEWFSMIPFSNDETVFLLPDSTYFGSKSATRHLGYLQDAKSLSYKQFDFNNNRPDLVLRALGNTDNKYLAIYDSTLAIRRRREGLHGKKSITFSKAPEVIITNEKDIKGEVKEKDLILQVQIKCAGQYPDRLAVFINGNPLTGTRGIRLSRKGYTIDTTLRLTLTEGRNYIELSAFDLAGQESYRQPLYVQYSPDTAVVKNIYFAGIGAAKYSAAGKNLTWATKDVTDVLDSLKKQYGNQVIVDTLFNSRVTLDNLRKLKSRFMKTRPDDIVILYYSGHGKIEVNKAEAFFGTYDMDFAHPSKKGISISEFNNLLDSIPARNKVIFLDACHSGEINKDAWIKGLAIGETDPFDIVLDLFTDLYQGNGTNIVVAARGLEAAKECNEIQHGVFTYAVLNGLSQMTADADTNAVLTIGELQNYVTRNVVLFSMICKPNILQRASSRKENEYNDWAVLTSTGSLFSRRSVVKEVKEEKPLTQQFSEGKKEVEAATQEATDVVSGSWDKKLEASKNIGSKIWGRIKGGKKDDVDELRKYQTNKHPKATALVTDAHFSVYYEKVKDNIIFNITCPGVIPSIRVDVNGNGEADPGTDRVYKKEKTSAGICAQYLLAAEQKLAAGADSQECNKQASAALLYVTGDQYLFMIPASELAATGNKSMVNFTFHGNDMKEVANYPQVAEGKIFEKTMVVNF